MSDEIRKFINTKDFQGFAKLLTAIERSGTEALKQPELLRPQSQAFRVGITGPPGAGKSTLIGGLITELRKAQLKVGVIAIDPSSPFSQGAILGDRIRYSEHFGDDQVFIRSLGTRGSLGGLSASSYLMLRAFDHFGFDVVIVETVGVGQTELEVMYVADLISVVLVPESGDSIQAMKAGLLEISNTYIVNKADRPGADSMANELKASRENVRIFKTIATEKKGVEDFAQFIQETYKKKEFGQKRQELESLRNEAKALLRMKYENQIQSAVDKIQSLDDFKDLLT